MELMTISEMSKTFDVSTRTLRYYEQVGLLQSTKKEGYAYRTYDAHAVKRLQQILVLRKLRLSLKQIADILQQSQTAKAVEIFRDQVLQLEQEQDALSSIRMVLEQLITVLMQKTQLPMQEDLFSDQSIIALVSSIVPPKSTLKEDFSMDSLNKAENILSKLKDVRIVHLPQTAVAAAHYIGPEPEGVVMGMIYEFVRENKLWEMVPDMRLFGFNHPNPTDSSGVYGYESWVTIPVELEVPAPLVKKQFAGGVYAAHMIKMGNFHEWGWLDAWVRENGRYQPNGSGTPEDMFGALEEHLNFFSEVQQAQPQVEQLDLLIPVKDTQG